MTPLIIEHDSLRDIPRYDAAADGASCRIYVWRIPSGIEEMGAACLHHDDYLLQRVKSTSAVKRRAEILAAAVLTWHVARAVIRHDEKGAPFLLDRPDLFCSISHSAGYIALALAPRCVGLDIEQRRDRALRVAEKFLQNDELAFVDANKAMLCPPDAATTLWSIKESVFKACRMADIRVITDVKITHFVDQRFEARVGERLFEGCHYLLDDIVLTEAQPISNHNLNH